MTILRDLDRAQSERFDVIVVGGGIYGSMLLLEASRRGLRAVGVEREDFGGATSWNHLRILHGGLRYLQSLDLARHRESVEERRRFLSDFGDFVHPLACWMPLQWSGLRNPLLMGTAARIDAWLSRRRNEGIEAERALPAARIWSGGERAAHTEGWMLPDSPAALRWFDAFAPRPRRLLMEVLHRACDAGALALNYTEALAPMVAGGSVVGLRARDLVGEGEYELHAPVILNAAGPGASALAASWGATTPPEPPPALSWNVLLDVRPAFDEALAVHAPRPGAPVLFLVPWEGRLLAGTGHVATGHDRETVVPPDALAAFLSDLAAALPSLDVRAERVLRVYSGLLPGVKQGSATLARKPTILDHGRAGGPDGLWTLCGVKFTTARRVAAEVLTRAGARLPRPVEGAPIAPEAKARSEARLARLRFGVDWTPEGDPEGRGILRSMIRDEAVVHLDDLLLRRTVLGDNPSTARRLAEELAPWLAEDEATRAAECRRVLRQIDRARSPLE